MSDAARAAPEPDRPRSAAFAPGPPPPQRIPRPPDVGPGSPAPWAGLSPARRRGLSLRRVQETFASPVDATRRPEPGGEGPRQSAVLAALFEEEGETRVVLTRRASTLRSHRSEVSFPGGRVDAEEALVAAALRESHEEVGIDPASVTVIGGLTPLMTFSSGALIHPFVGVLPDRPALHVNPAEVERAFDVALAELLSDRVHRSERWRIASVVRDMHFFEVPGDIIWGATARMLWELLARVTGTLPAPTPEDGPLP